MRAHLIGNLSWQSDYWYDRPTNEDIRTSGHGDPQQDGVMWERFNFNFERCVRNGKKLGFLICQSPPKSFRNGEGIVFFASRGYIVGLYALPTTVPINWNDFTEFSEEASNISAPLELCVRWKTIDRVPIDKTRFYAGRKTIRKYIYIGDAEAQAIIADAITAHSDAADVQGQLRLVARSVWGPAADL
jgi:hypothetical protein